MPSRTDHLDILYLAGKRHSLNIFMSFWFSKLRIFEPVIPRLFQRHSVTIYTMATPTHYDAIIIGSGQAGTPLASALTQAGKKTALIERKHIGGCCINEGCTPTKTMIASGRVAYLTGRAPRDYGVHTSPEGTPGSRLEIEMTKIRQRKRDIVDEFRGGSEKRLCTAGVEVLRGQAEFKNHKEILVSLDNGETQTLTAELIFINTGERPSRPSVPGMDRIDPSRLLDSTSVMELADVPEHLVILGGGYIGLEFGQLFRRLGADVTIIQRASRLVPREDPDISATILDIMQEDGIVVHLSVEASELTDSRGSPITVNIKSQDSRSIPAIHGSHLLFAGGRTPNTERLNLGATAVSMDGRGHISTGDYLETSVPGIYALGDVKGGPAFTHISYDDFRIVRDHLLSPPATPGSQWKPRGPLSSRTRLLPYTIFTDPQMGHVGLHEAEARKQFPDMQIKTAVMPMAYVARALETGETRGMMKAVVNAETGEILGFSCLGIEGGEVMSTVQVAMMGGLRWWELREAIFAHPTIAESLKNLWQFLK
jgi:pyruvate/2-oxoglutarate dehydrogenase complex dihydrolipoamide dehydrogenase (E3) component